MNNWRTTLTGIGTAVTTLLGVVAMLPDQLGPIAEIIPPAYKTKVVVIAWSASFVLRCANAIVQADKKQVTEPPAPIVAPGLPVQPGVHQP